MYFLVLITSVVVSVAKPQKQANQSIKQIKLTLSISAREAAPSGPMEFLHSDSFCMVLFFCFK